jgi:hypothetical protein
VAAAARLVVSLLHQLPPIAGGAASYRPGGVPAMSIVVSLSFLNHPSFAWDIQLVHR